VRFELETKTLFVGLLVGLAHIACGMAVLVTPQALLVTPLDAIRSVQNYLGLQHGFSGAILIGVGIMAVIASRRQVYLKTRMLLFAPQQCMLFLQIAAISWALIVGTYPDGYKPVGGAWFILADQIFAYLLAVSHSIWLAALLYGGENFGRHT
jgi:hypothetical protein